MDIMKKLLTWLAALASILTIIEPLIPKKAKAETGDKPPETKEEMQKRWEKPNKTQEEINQVNKEIEQILTPKRTFGITKPKKQ